MPRSGKPDASANKIRFRHDTVIVSFDARLAITAGLMAAVLVLSLIPGKTNGENSFIIRLVAATPQKLQKVMHVVLYALMAFLLAWTFEALSSAPVAILAALIVSVIYGGLLEWLQTRIPGRFGTMHDVLRNAVGATIGLVAASVVL